MTAPTPPPKKPKPTVFEIAGMATKAHWVLEQLAYDLPHGTATSEQRDAVVLALKGLAALLEQYGMADDS